MEENVKVCRNNIHLSLNIGDRVTTTCYKRFYTPRELASFLISICNINPISTVDICAGSWNLLTEAKRRWPNIEVVGVDISSSVENTKICDGRLFSYDSVLQKRFYDLVVANPPFGYEKPSKEILNKINELVKGNNFSGNVLSRIEATMMIFNALLVKPDGLLAAIVPISLVNSETYKSLRVFLTQSYSLERIVYLPRSAFGSRQINTCIIILRRKKTNNSTIISKAFFNNGYFSEEIGSIPVEGINLGYWSFGTNLKENKNNITLQIKRNDVSSSDIKETGKYPVIHSSSFKSESNHQVLHRKFYTNRLPVNATYTSKGDILIIRVGKKTGSFVLVDKEYENCLTSDCVLIVKPNGQIERQRIIRNLRKRQGELHNKGVVVKYLTKNDIINII